MTTLKIDEKEYEIEEPVSDLIILISKERDELLKGAKRFKEQPTNWESAQIAPKDGSVIIGKFVIGEETKVFAAKWDNNFRLWTLFADQKWAYGYALVGWQNLPSAE